MYPVLRIETSLDHLIDILYPVHYYGLSRRNAFLALVLRLPRGYCFFFFSYYVFVENREN